MSEFAHFEGRHRVRYSGAWLCFGDYDLILIADVPVNERMAAMALAVAARQRHAEALLRLFHTLGKVEKGNSVMHFSNLGRRSRSQLSGGQPDSGQVADDGALQGWYLSP